MMTPDQRDPVHRGRRKDDQILDGWTWGRVIKILTALTLAGGAAAGVTGLAASIVVTRPQLEAVSDTVAAVNEKLDTLRARTDGRFQRLEARQLETERQHDLIPGFLRLQCLQLRRDNSESLADAAGVPCDSLLRRTR